MSHVNLSCAILPVFSLLLGASNGNLSQQFFLLSILIGFNNLDHDECSIVRTPRPANVPYDVNPSLPIPPFPLEQNLSSKLIVPTDIMQPTCLQIKILKSRMCIVYLCHYLILYSNVKVYPKYHHTL